MYTFWPHKATNKMQLLCPVWDLYGPLITPRNEGNVAFPKYTYDSEDISLAEAQVPQDNSRRLRAESGLVFLVKIHVEQVEPECKVLFI